jgi:glutamate--cysteine ligase
MPKPRYGIMREYLPTRGRLAHWMMLMTCSIQANYDYRDERDAFEMLRLASKIGPLVTAIFANSPIREGADDHVASSRMQIWQETDPDRCGTPDFFLDEDNTFEDYIDYILDIPMFFIKRNDEYLSMAGRSFRKFMNNGFEGHEPTLGDFELHLSTAFPDIRLKRFVEVRTADGNMPDRILALSALWKGIFYDDLARQRAEDLVPLFTGRELDALALACRRDGLNGTWRGQSIRDLSGELIRIAGEGLDAQASSPESERAYLDCLTKNGEVFSSAEQLRRDWHELDGDRQALIERYSLRQYLEEVPSSTSIP